MLEAMLLVRSVRDAGRGKGGAAVVLAMFRLYTIFQDWRRIAVTCKHHAAPAAGLNRTGIVSAKVTKNVEHRCFLGFLV